MTREEFKKVLDKWRYRWREEGEWIVVEKSDTINLNGVFIESLPDNVKFNNEGYVYLDSLESIPDNIQFNNGGGVSLNSIKSIPNNVQFNNGGYVIISSLKSIPYNIQFNNGGYVYLDSLESIPVNSDSDEMFPKCRGIRINNLFQDIQFPNSRWTSVDGKVQMYESWVKNNY